MQNKNPKFQAASYSIILFSILITIYTLTYSGTFTTDDEHILASRTFSIAFDETINDYRVLGNSRIFSYITLDPDYGEQSLNIEPMQAILGASLARIANSFQIGRVQTIFFLNIFLTALTALAIFWILIKTGYTNKTSLITSFLFGLCTSAWPYSQTYFRDVSAMLFVTVAWGSVLILTSKHPMDFSLKPSSTALWLGLVSSLVLGILSKNSVILVIPALLFLLIRENKISFKRHLTEWKKQKTFIVIALILLISSFLIWLLLPRQSGIFSRFTPFYFATVIDNINNQTHSFLIEGILGPVISPGKSIFLYSPILLLAVISLIRFYKKAIYVWIYFVIIVIAQAIYYDSIWWGSINWGLRFLLPTIPILMLSSAPVIESILSKKMKIPLMPLAIVSFLIQIIGLWIPVRDYFIQVVNPSQEPTNSSFIWNPKLSQIWWNITKIFSGEVPNSTFFRIGLKILPLLLMFLIALVIMLLILWRKPIIQFAVPCLFLASTMIGLLLFQLRNDPLYLPREDLENSHDYIKDNYSLQDYILIRSYGTPVWYYWMNWSDPNLKWISLSIPLQDTYSTSQLSLFHGSSETIDDTILNLFDSQMSTNRNIWVVSPSDSRGENIQLEALSDILQTQYNLSLEFKTENFSSRVYQIQFP